MRMVTVDFHLKETAELTWALLEEVEPPGPVRPGEWLLATDGDVTHRAVVDGIDARGRLRLRVLFEPAGPTPCPPMCPAPATSPEALYPMRDPA